MAVAYRDDLSTTGTDATAEGTIPAATVDGDLMVAFLAHSSSSATITTAPSGWTLREADPNPADFSCVCYERIKQAGDANPTWTWSAAGNWTVDIVSLSGVDQTTPVNVSIGEQTAGVNAIALGPVTPTVNNCLLVGWAVLDATGSARTWTQDGAMTEVIDQTDNQVHRSAAYEVLSGGSGVGQTRTFTFTGSTQDVAGFLLAVAPAAAGLSGTVAQASETDTAQPVGRLRAVAVGQASVAHSALAVAGSSRTTVGQAVDTGSALPVGRAHAFTVGQSVSINTAAALTATSRTVIAQATDISTAGDLARTRARATTQASVMNTAQPVSSTHTRAVGQAASIASAGAMTVAGGNTIGTASEVSAARLLGALSVRQVAQASSVGAALSVAGRRASTLTQAVSTSAALGLGSRKTRLVLAATGADTAFSVGIPAPVLPAVVRLDVGHGVSGMGGGAGVSGVAGGLGVSQVESSSELIGVG